MGRLMQGRGVEKGEGEVQRLTEVGFSSALPGTG